MTRQLQALTAILLLCTGTYTVAGILKCVDDEGNIYFSDVACPENADRQYIPAYKSDADYYARKANPGSSYNSVIQQARRMETQRRLSRAEHAVRSQAASGGVVRSSGNVHLMDEKIKKLKRKEKRLSELAFGNTTNLRKKWSRESLSEVSQERRALELERARALGETEVYEARKAAEAAARRQRNWEWVEQQEREHLDAERAHEERINEVETAFKREKRNQEIGVPGREGNYRRAKLECRHTFGAYCQ